MHLWTGTLKSEEFPSVNARGSNEIFPRTYTNIRRTQMKTSVRVQITAELAAAEIAVELLVVASPDGERDSARMEPSEERPLKGSARTA